MRWLNASCSGLVFLFFGLMPVTWLNAQTLSADSVDRLLDRSFNERQERPREAAAWARTALDWALVAQDTARVADAWRKIALAQRVGVSSRDSAISSMTQALELSSAIGDTKGEQSAAKSLGKWYSEGGEHAQGLAMAERSLRVAEAAGDKNGICSALVTKGLAQKSLGDMEAAAATFYRGLEIARVLADTTRLLDLLGNIGSSYLELDRTTEARHYFLEQRVTAAVSRRLVKLADAHRNLAMVANEQGDPADALLLVDSAFIVYEQAGGSADDRFIAMVNKGNYLVQLGRTQEAIGLLDEALRISRDLDRPKDRSFLLVDLAGIAIEDERFTAADSLLGMALRDAGKHLRARTMVLRQLSTLREREGRWREAKDILQAYVLARDSFFNERATDQFARAEMRQKYKAHEQEIEIADLGHRISQEQQLRNLILAISALALVMAVLAWRNWRFQRQLRLQHDVMHQQQVSQLLKQQEIRTLDAVMHGQEQERSRIAKDLHDRVGSLLSAVKFQFGALETRIDQVQSTAGAQYQKATDLLDTAVSEVRRISHEMVHGTLSTFGLATALEDLREAVHVPGKLEVDLNLFGLEERFDKRIEVAAYRMVQEAVSNALKHAKAANLTIQATRVEGSLNLMVEDDGKGFDVSAINDGMGMANLRERAAEFNGTVRVDSGQGRGTTVIIDLPLPATGAHP